MFLQLAMLCILLLHFVSVFYKEMAGTRTPANANQIPPDLVTIVFKTCRLQLNSPLAIAHLLPAMKTGIGVCEHDIVPQENSLPAIDS